MRPKFSSHYSCMKIHGEARNEISEPAMRRGDQREPHECIGLDTILPRTMQRETRDRG